MHFNIFSFATVFIVFATDGKLSCSTYFKFLLSHVLKCSDSGSSILREEKLVILLSSNLLPFNSVASSVDVVCSNRTEISGNLHHANWGTTGFHILYATSVSGPASDYRIQAWRPLWASVGKDAPP